MKRNIIKILSFVLFMALSVIFALLGKEIFGIFLGGIFILCSILALIKRLRFHYATKEIEIGEVSNIVEIRTSEDGRSYEMYISYEYNKIKYFYKNAISSFTLIRKYSIGDKKELLVNVNNPKEVKVNEQMYLRLDYYGAIIFFIIGILFIYFSIK